MAGAVARPGQRDRPAALGGRRARHDHPLRVVTGDLRRAHDAEEARRSRFEHRRSFDRAAYPDEVDLHQERRRALSFAASGYDYPYSYPGAPFPSSAIGIP
ncbi:hypothetical protein ACIOD0_24000 [Kitasatospora albolonga]